MSAQALSDLKVLDLTHYIAGPFCTKLLADFGADVIKVERPGSGDGARHAAPFLEDIPHPEKSGLFLYLNNNKRGITLNLKNRSGVRIFKELTSWADVMVENFRPSVMPRLGLSYETLEQINPRLVMTSISNFGQTGPYKEYKANEIIFNALSGLMHASGVPEREPIKMGGNVIQYNAGASAALHTLIALQGSENRGGGDHVDLSILDVFTGSIDRTGPMLLAYQYTGESTKRGYQRRSGGAPRRCKDGYLNVFTELDFIPKALDMIGLPALSEDPRFATPEARARQENIDDFLVLFDPWLLEHTVEESWAAAQKARILSGPVSTVEQLSSNLNFSARDFWCEVEREYIGNLTYPGRPFIMNDGPWSLRRAAPTLGQHNEEIYCGLLGYSKAEQAKLRETGVI